MFWNLFKKYKYKVGDSVALSSCMRGKIEARRTNNGYYRYSVEYLVNVWGGKIEWIDESCVVCTLNDAQVNLLDTIKSKNECLERSLTSLEKKLKGTCSELEGLRDSFKGKYEDKEKVILLHDPKELDYINKEFYVFNLDSLMDAAKGNMELGCDYLIANNEKFNLATKVIPVRGFQIRRVEGE